MPTSPARTDAKPVRWRLILALVLPLVLIAAVILVVVNPFRGEDPTAQEPTTDCTPYGLEADDPRAHPRTVTADGGAATGSAAGSAAASDEQDSSRAGALGQLEQSFTHQGVTSRYHVIDGGVDASEPVGLVIHLHGDGGAEYADTTGRTTCLAAVAASHNALLVVPLTPDCAGRCTWWEELRPNLQWLRALVEDRLLTDLPVERDRLTWMGYSGGAEMLSYGVLSDARELVSAGAAMVGGGGAPRTLQEPATAQQREEQRLWWFTGSEDDGTDPAASFDAVAAATRGQRFYDDRGFEQTRLEILPERDHFDMPDARILDELLSAQDTAADPGTQ